MPYFLHISPTKTGETGVAYGFAEQERWEGDPFHRLKEAFDWLNGQF